MNEEKINDLGKVQKLHKSCKKYEKFVKIDMNKIVIRWWNK